MKSNPYLMFSGRCEDAFKFYEKTLGGRIVMKMTYGDAPEPEMCTPVMKDQIMHARLEANGLVLMGSDSPPERYQEPQGFFVSLSIDQPEEAERVFAALSENGTIHMPMEETFWAHRFGMLADQFGIPWMVNCEKQR